MMLFHPGLAALSCTECQTKLYQIEGDHEGEPLSYDATNRETGAREKQYHTDPTTHPFPPCRHGVKCLKGTPETSHEVELHELNQTTLAAWARWRAGLRTGELDELAADNFATINRLVEQSDRKRLAEQTAGELAQILSKVL